MSDKFRLSGDSFGAEEKAAVQEVMDSGFYSMGKKVRQFESEFAQWVGAKHAVMVNSGSSANLLLIASLITRANGNAPLKPGDEVLVPALSWPTTVWPISQLGLVPVFVDIDPKTLAVSVESMKKQLSAKTKALFMIHVLGQAANMNAIESFCQENQITLVEDCCESFGSYFNKKHVGNFGIGGTFSHFFSHHLTTVEGGTITTNDDELADDLRSLRAHGWTRDRLDKEEWHKKYEHLDPRFLFVMPGFNVRPTDIQGALGSVQLKRVETFLQQRDEVARSVVEISKKVPWIEVIGGECLPEKPFSSRHERTHSWMNIPFRLKADAPMAVKQVMQALEEAGVETRPIIAGNITKHPAIDHIECRMDQDLKESDRLLSHGFMIGCNPGPESEQALPTLEKAFLKLVQ